MLKTENELDEKIEDNILLFAGHFQAGDMGLANKRLNEIKSLIEQERKAVAREIFERLKEAMATFRTDGIVGYWQHTIDVDLFDSIKQKYGVDHVPDVRK